MQNIIIDGNRSGSPASNGSVEPAAKVAVSTSCASDLVAIAERGGGRAGRNGMNFRAGPLLIQIIQSIQTI